MDPIYTQGGITALVMVALLGVAVSDAEPEPPGFTIFHWKSETIEEDGKNLFREVFVVDKVLGGLHVSPANIQMFYDGEPFEVNWTDDNSLIDHNDTFYFDEEAFDIQHHLSAEYEGREIMRCRFGGGAAQSVHPDVLRELGYGHVVRCLDHITDG